MTNDRYKVSDTLKTNFCIMLIYSLEVIQVIEKADVWLKLEAIMLSFSPVSMILLNNT